MLMKAISKVLEKVAADPQHAAHVMDKDDGYMPPPNNNVRYYLPFLENNYIVSKICE